MTDHSELYEDEDTMDLIREFSQQHELTIDYVISEFVLDNLFIPAQ